MTDAFSSPERQKASLAWLKWIGQEKIQANWAELGGYACNGKVLKSQIFLKAQPFNPAFA